jgi:hypothetical protein
VTAIAVFAALNLPAAARVDQRVPKKLLLENGAPTAADKRLINEGIEAIQWLAVLKPATCGVPDFRDEVREYLEIAVLHVTLREQAKEARLIELLHRAVPYPVLILVECGQAVSVSLAHKRYALKEAGKTVLDSEPVTVPMQTSNEGVQAAFLQALNLVRQPRASLYTLYQAWLDTVVALQAALVTGAFSLLDSAERAQQRREAFHTCLTLQSKIVSLRNAAAKASQIARQIELNMELRRLLDELSVAQTKL